ncbi:MAG TPA: hypothetical protein VFI24_01775 [Pyrinomonadaceae bacterium]|nr:hypothetical protein [Pyrinomonadaceae bacterium]
MSFYSAIYGLQIHLNESVPGLLLSRQQSQAVDIEIHFGSMPASFQGEQASRELWYVNPEPGVGGKPRLVVWSFADHFNFQYADGTEFLIDAGGTRIWATWPSETLTLEDTATYLLGPVMGFVLLLRGFISLHACAVAIDERAVAIVGPAGSGKSTTAAAFAERGYRILAEDVVTLRERDGEFMVQPGVPSIRLWPSSVEVLYGTASALPKLTPTWDKCYLDLTQEKYQFQQEPLPLAAIYLLSERRDDVSAPVVEDLTAAEGLMSLIANTYATYLMNKEMRAREFALLQRVLSSVPLKRVTPHSDAARIDELCQVILGASGALGSGQYRPR